MMCIGGVPIGIPVGHSTWSPLATMILFRYIYEVDSDVQQICWTLTNLSETASKFCHPTSLLEMSMENDILLDVKFDECLTKFCLLYATFLETMSYHIFFQ
jgi:hypothetical protein